MCCFSQAVSHVGMTRIFARLLDAQTQVLVYQMQVEAAVPVAMVLPLPMREGAEGFAFLDLSRTKDFFDQVHRLYPVAQTRSDGFGLFGGAVPASAPLPVESVGDFVASLVPTIADFARLDPQFQIAPEVWAGLPAYATYGFAVFQLKPGRIEPQPMALRFPTALPGQLFFPTVHIHDGSHLPQAHFDHTLYAQAAAVRAGFADWEESPGILKGVVSMGEHPQVIDLAGHCYRRTVVGVLPNDDIIV